MLLPNITVEDYYIISILLMFNLYFLCFRVDELHAFIISICIFELYFCILLESGCSHLISTNKWFCMAEKLRGTKQIFMTLILNFKSKCISVWGGLPHPQPHVYLTTTLINLKNKYLKFLFRSRSLIKIFREIWTKPRREKKRFGRFCITLYIAHKFLIIVQCFVKLIYWKTLYETKLSQIPALVTHISEFCCAVL